jgi:hypothetical protein
MKKYYLLILTVFILIDKPVHAQTDTIRLAEKRLITSALKPGLRQYLVYFQSPAKKKSLGFWFWLRDIKTENRNGEKVFAITQHWYGNDTNSYRSVYSINRVADFAPLYHSETIKNITKAYNWNADKITGADSIANNAQKNFLLNSI